MGCYECEELGSKGHWINLCRTNQVWKLLEKDFVLSKTNAVRFQKSMNFTGFHQHISRNYQDYIALPLCLLFWDCLLFLQQMNFWPQQVQSFSWCHRQSPCVAIPVTYYYTGKATQHGKSIMGVKWVTKGAIRPQFSYYTINCPSRRIKFHWQKASHPRKYKTTPATHFTKVCYYEEPSDKLYPKLFTAQ